MRIGLVTSAGGWRLDDLRRAALGFGPDSSAPEGVSIELVDARRLASHVEPRGEALSSGGQRLDALDALLVGSLPAGSLEQVVFRMDALARAEAAGVVVVNSPKAMETAVDKYLTTARMAAAGLLVPPTMVCQTADEALAAFHSLGGDVVVKPLFGGEGRGVARLSDDALAERAFSLLASLGAVFYLQQFIPSDGQDVRVLLIGRRSWAIRRHNPLDWRANVSRGAVATPLAPSDAMLEVTGRAAAATGTEIAGIDLIVGLDGRLWAIEVNAAPGWRATAAAHGVDIAAACLEYLVERVGRRGRTS